MICNMYNFILLRWSFPHMTVICVAENIKQYNLIRTGFFPLRLIITLQVKYDSGWSSDFTSLLR